jgi:hypothetical protein
VKGVGHVVLDEGRSKSQLASVEQCYSAAVHAGLNRSDVVGIKKPSRGGKKATWPRRVSFFDALPCSNVVHFPDSFVHFPCPSMAQEIQRPANEGVMQRMVADMVRDSFCSR